MATFKHLKQICVHFDGIEQEPNMPIVFNCERGAYTTIDAICSKSVKRPKYCDFNGFLAKYNHPNGIRYSQHNQFYNIEKMAKSNLDEILSLRKAVQVLK